MTVYTRLEKIIKKTWYKEETLIPNLKIYLELNTITQDEYDSLLSLIEEHPGTVENEMSMHTTNEVYFMLKRQIEKTAYTAEQISEMVTNFSLAKTINDSELIMLSNKIKEVYFPVIESEIEDTEDTVEDEIIDVEILK